MESIFAEWNAMSPREQEQFRVDSYNSTVGKRNEEDGYDCPLCLNRGDIFKLVDFGEDRYGHVSSACQCVPVRNNIMRMKRSGLKNIISEYTFDKFETDDPWQHTLKAVAMEYAANPEGWFFLGGQSGCGKTHICTAICREHLLAGKSVKYMLWRDDVVKLKAMANDEGYGDLIRPYKEVDILYIDDLFKTGKAQDGSQMKPTGADINVAFEIINHRYVNNKVTIISSELLVDDIIDIDEAVGGRIFERAKKAISIPKDRKKNYRTRNAVTL